MTIFNKYKLVRESLTAQQENILDIINANKVSKDFYTLVETTDFTLKYDDASEDHITLNWIYIKNKSSNISGTDLFKALIEIAKSKGIYKIFAYGIKGYDIIEVDGVKKSIWVNGYYTMLRWGFIPDKGIHFLNKILKTNYNSLEEAYKEQNFWDSWKENGKEFTGVFDLSSEETLSMRILNKNI